MSDVILVIRSERHENPIIINTDHKIDSCVLMPDTHVGTHCSPGLGAMPRSRVAASNWVTQTPTRFPLAHEATGARNTWMDFTWGTDGERRATTGWDWGCVRVNSHSPSLTHSRTPFNTDDRLYIAAHHSPAFSAHECKLPLSLVG